MYISNKFCDILKIEKGITAVTGSGGKTSLIRLLAGELSEKGTVAICTSTRIFKPDDIPVYTGEYALEESEALRAGISGEGRIACIGNEAVGNPLKLSAPSVPFADLAGAFDYVLVEADGSAHLPLKCHNDREPVIPAGKCKVIVTVGLSGIGMPVGEAVHRPELFAKLTGAAYEDIVTAAVAARAMLAEARLYTGYETIIFINQADTEADAEAAAELASELRELKFPIYAGSVRNGAIERIGGLK